MHASVAQTTIALLALLCPAAPPLHAGATATGCIAAGPEDPSVDGDLDDILLRVDDPKPAPATSDRARVAPGPSERTEPAAPEVCQTPASGETGSSERVAPAAPNVRQAPAGGETGSRPPEAGKNNRHG